MHIEIRKRGKNKLYYLAHSFRDNGKVRKIRRYLGKNLTEKEIEKLKERAEKSILEQIESYKKIRDPLHTILSPEETKRIKFLIKKSDIKIKHLSEKQWLTFTELFTYNTNAIEGSSVTATEVRNVIESRVSDVLEKAGVKVVNCTPDSPLECFEKMSLDEYFLQQDKYINDFNEE